MNYFKEYALLLLFFSTVYGLDVLESSLPDLDGTTEQCGKTRFDSKEARSTLPGKAAVGQFPWVARIGFSRYKEKSEKTDKKEVEFICEGSVIGAHYVITASQCELYGRMVRIGENSLDKEIDCDECDNECAPPHQDIEVSRVFKQEECTFNKSSDVCIMELKTPVEFSARKSCVSGLGGAFIGHKKGDAGRKVAYLAGIATRKSLNCNGKESMPVVYTDISHLSDWISKTVKGAVSTRNQAKPVDQDDEEIKESSSDKPPNDMDDTLATNETSLATNDTVLRTNQTEEILSA